MRNSLYSGLVLLLAILLVGGFVKVVRLITWKPSDIQIYPASATLPTMPLKP